MRPLRSLTLAVGLTALLAVPAGAQAASNKQAISFQAKVTSISAKTKRLKGKIQVVTAATNMKKYKGKTLTFDISKVTLNIVDRNKDGKGNTIKDILKKDLVGITAIVPKGTTLPKVITAMSFQDLTALLSTPTVPGAPTGPPTINLPGGAQIPTVPSGNG